MELQAAKFFAAAISLASLFGIGLGLGLLFSGYMNAVARNPSAQPKLQTMAFIGMALIEALGLFALVIAFIILFG